MQNAEKGMKEAEKKFKGEEGKVGLLALLPFLAVGGGLALLWYGFSHNVKGLLLDLGSFCFIGGILSFLMYLDFYYSLQRLFLGEQSDDHTGISGYRRSILAIGVILVFAWLLFRLGLPQLSQMPAEVVQGTLQNAVGVLSGVLASLAGFYFGGKAAQGQYKREEKARKEGAR